VLLTTGGESSQQVEKSPDTVPGTVTNSYQVEAQLRLVVEVVSAVLPVIRVDFSVECIYSGGSRSLGLGGR